MNTDTNGPHPVLAAQILDPDDPADRALLDQLQSDPIDSSTTYHIAAGKPARRADRPGPLLAEPRRWAYYPWRRGRSGVGAAGFPGAAVGPQPNLITADEQARLGTLRIGIGGLSVGTSSPTRWRRRACAGNCGSRTSTASS